MKGHGRIDVCVMMHRPIKDVFVFFRAQDNLELLGFKHLRSVVPPTLLGEVDLVDPVLLLPAAGPEAPVRLPHHNNPRPDMTHNEWSMIFL